jgi:transposase-like protein
MKKNIKQQRLKAVQRFLNGEEPDGICASIGRSRSWLYKWVVRYAPDNLQWFDDQSRRPLTLIIFHLLISRICQARKY